MWSVSRQGLIWCNSPNAAQVVCSKDKLNDELFPLKTDKADAFPITNLVPFQPLFFFIPDRLNSLMGGFGMRNIVFFFIFG